MSGDGWISTMDDRPDYGARYQIRLRPAYEPLRRASALLLGTFDREADGFVVAGSPIIYDLTAVDYFRRAPDRRTA